MVLNWVRLGILPKNQIVVAFCIFPIIRIYSMEGQLIREFRTTSGIIEKFEPINNKMIDLIRSGGQAPRAFVANAVFADADGIYIAIAAPRRIEILLFDEFGKTKEYYFLNVKEPTGCFGLIVKKTLEGKRFFILRSYPQARIEELAPQ
jgi:hypothetical protein